MYSSVARVGLEDDAGDYLEADGGVKILFEF